jgi:hypothetical protein
VSADVIYCDETSFMNTEVFYQVIIPIFEMSKTTLICISTPMDTFNFYTALVNLVHPKTGLPIFNTYRLELICERCKKKKYPARCKHKLGYIPPWKSQDKLEIVKIIYQDMQHVLQRESLYIILFIYKKNTHIEYRGVVSDQGNSCIDLENVKTFNAKKEWDYEGKDDARFVLVFMDPNAGGKNEMAIIAGTHIDGQRIVSNIILYILFSWICKSNIFYIIISNCIYKSNNFHITI